MSGEKYSRLLATSNWWWGCTDECAKEGVEFRGWNPSFPRIYCGSKRRRKAIALAERVAQNAPLTNFAVLQALPMIAEANPQTGLLMESLMATVAQSDQEAKSRIRAFLDHKTAKVKPS